MTSRPAPAGPPAQLSSRDTGLFGPESVTWRVLSEPVMWIAGLRAMYLQALHPDVMMGTWQNTAFAKPDEAWGRFTRTVEFVRVRTYGTSAEAARAGRRVRKVHASLTGTDADGTTIRLDEPELLTWVHCGEIASYADVASRCGMGLSARDLDAFVDEQRRSAAVVGLDPAAVPASVAALNAYHERVRPSLYVCAEAKHVLRRSFNPDVPTRLLPLKLVVPPLNVLAFATLPRWARRMYGMPGAPLTDVGATVALRMAHRSVTHIPRELIYLPAARAARRRERERRSAA